MDAWKDVPKYATFELSSAVTYDFKVSGHDDDDHKCAAVTHACGEVNLTFYFLCFRVLYVSHIPSHVISPR